MVRVGINGFGRIGRLASRATQAHPEVTVAAVNDLADIEQLGYLLRHDSVHGPHPLPVVKDGDGLRIGDDRIPVTQERDATKLPWGEHGVDVVIESTGAFRSREKAAAHLEAGARKVVISAPADGVDATFCLGVNDGTYDAGSHHVVSNASCTTNALAPMAAVLNREFGIERGLLNTTHSYTSSQSLVDQPARKLRRGRAAAVSLVPTSTGAARAVGLVLPQLAGRLDGLAVRAPVPDGSLVDLTCVLRADASSDRINDALREASREPGLEGVLAVADEELVSADILGDPRSCLVDASSTLVVGSLAKVLAWYDNEWGYANRLVECAVLLATGRRPETRARLRLPH